MSERAEDLIRDHYRRVAENIRPDAELIDRYRNAGRPARARPVRAGLLLAAAAVALTALVTWGLLRPGHRDVPVTPPPSPTGHPSPVVTPTPSPSPSKPRTPSSPPVRRAPDQGTARPSSRPTRPVTDPPERRPSARPGSYEGQGLRPMAAYWSIS